MDTIDEYLVRIFGHEGGYVNDPRDPGGETRWGISKAANPQEDIKHLSQERAAEIYRTKYWRAGHCDDLPPEVQFDMFDATINHGPGNSIRFLQRAAGVADDGQFGPISLAAVHKANPLALLARFNGHRLQFMTDLTTWKTYNRGWARRIAANLKEVKDA